MSENLRKIMTAVHGFDAVARRVPDNRWDQPSPVALSGRTAP